MEKMHRRNVNCLTDLSVQITISTSENVHRVIHSIKLLQRAYTGYYVMRKGGSDMDNFQLSMIQKLFTVRMMSSEKKWIVKMRL